MEHEETQHFTEGDDRLALSKGIFRAYTEENLRYSQTVPLTMYEERNSGCNLPAQIDLYATSGDEYSFLFIAKGGGSANKTFLFQATPSRSPLTNSLTRSTLDSDTPLTPTISSPEPLLEVTAPLPSSTLITAVRPGRKPGIRMYRQALNQEC